VQSSHGGRENTATRSIKAKKKREERGGKGGGGKERKKEGEGDINQKKKKWTYLTSRYLLSPLPPQLIQQKSPFTVGCVFTQNFIMSQRLKPCRSIPSINSNNMVPMFTLKYTSKALLIDITVNGNVVKYHQ
jgi:hypothetical protein